MLARSAALALVTALVGCNPDYALHRTPPGGLPVEAAHPAPSVRVLLTSDFGHGRSLQRWRVLERMKAREGETPFDFVLVAGDNDHDCGPDATLPGAEACAFGPDGNTLAPGVTVPDDPGFASAIDEPLGELGGGVSPQPPVYLALGTHDVATQGKCAVSRVGPEPLARTKACLEVAHLRPTWHMPGRHYLVDAGPLRVVVLDGNLLKGDYGGFRFEDELAFVRAAMAGCDGRLCFVSEHFPPVTGGPARRREPPEFVARVAQVEAAAGPGLRGWLCGHHHDLQHLRTLSGRDVFVFGNSAFGRDARHEQLSVPGADLEFFSTRYGFAVLEAAGDRWWVRFEGVRGEPLHCCEAQGTGRCEPVACGPERPGPLPGARVAASAVPPPPEGPVVARTPAPVNPSDNAVRRAAPTPRGGTARVPTN